MLEHVHAWQKFSTVETMGTRACDFKTVRWRQEADQSCGARETNGETLTRGADWASVFGSAGK